jgi:hypothetical protein
MDQAGTVTQWWRRSCQTDCVGAGNDGSPKAPTATATSSGLRSASQNTVEPQSGQKWNTTPCPLSDGRWYRLDRPSAATSLRGKNAAMP